MPLTLDSPNQSRQPLPPSSHDASSHTPSHVSADDGASSSSSLLSPMGSSMRFNPMSPTSPLANSFTFGNLKSAQPSIDVSRMAVQGSSPPGSAHIKGFKVKAVDANPPWPGSKTITEHVLQEEPAQFGNGGLYDADNDDDDEDVQDEVKDLPKGETYVNRKDTDDLPVVQNGRVIALDFDDVCCLYIPTLAAEHNAKYGTNITAEDFKSPIYFQNRGWGTPAETQRKLAILDTALPQTAPVPGFATALKALRALGHPLHIVTARPAAFKNDIEDWLKVHAVTVGTGEDDTVAAVWCCSTYAKEPIPVRRETTSGIAEEDAYNKRLLGLHTGGKGGSGKLRVLRAINAALFIDDHHGNLEPIVSSEPPIPCLLFGEYPWNRSRSGITTPGEMMSFDQRTKAGLEITVEDIEMGLHLRRVKGWADVISWVKQWDRKAAAGSEE